MLKGYTKEDGYTNSYGYNVLNELAEGVNAVVLEAAKNGGPDTDVKADALIQNILAVMDTQQASVENDEVRSYMNETIWYASKQTAKEKWNGLVS